MMMEIDKIHQYFNRFHALVLGRKVTLIAQCKGALLNSQKSSQWIFVNGNQINRKLIIT